MAEFNIKRQHAHIIQQAEVINTDTFVTWEDVSEQLYMLLPEVKGLIAAGELDAQVGAELHAAISEATAAKERNGVLSALAKASNIALGVSILSGISQTIANIIQLLPR
jgi:hypothetical protein